jgi:hypothetical protein
MKTSHLPSIVVLMAALTIGMAGITSDALAHGGHGGGGHGGHGGGGHGHSSSAGHGAGVSGVGGAAGAMRSGSTVDRGVRRGEVPAATTGAGPDTLGDWAPIW